MIYRRTEHFKKQYHLMPKEIQEKAKKVFTLLQSDTNHPSLHIKKVQGTSGIWEGRIDRQYRFTFQYQDEGGEKVCLFRNIDHHDECLNNP